MVYKLMGYLHAAISRRVGELRRLAGETGQGTVEYVGLILLIAVVMAGVVKASGGFSDDKSIATAVVDKLKDAIGDVGSGK
ncbi:MAG: hypothetical protein ACJ76B_08050 [Solirubrobacterales bacterium]